MVYTFYHQWEVCIGEDSHITAINKMEIADQVHFGKK